MDYKPVLGSRFSVLVGLL